MAAVGAQQAFSRGGARVLNAPKNEPALAGGRVSRSVHIWRRWEGRDR
jgi:hypothetical protein